MTKFSVQFLLPCEYPERNVSMKRSKGEIQFFVPINYPDCSHLTFWDLMAAQELAGLFTVSTPLNNNQFDFCKEFSHNRSEQPSHGHESKAQEATRS